MVIGHYSFHFVLSHLTLNSSYQDKYHYYLVTAVKGFTVQDPFFKRNRKGRKKYAEMLSETPQHFYCLMQKIG